jgi:hypothetical protein
MVLLANCFMLVSCLSYSSTLKTKAIFNVLTGRYIPEDRTQLSGVRKSGFTDVTAMLPQLRAEQRLTHKPHD